MFGGRGGVGREMEGGYMGDGWGGGISRRCRFRGPNEGMRQVQGVERTGLQGFY